MAAKKPNPFAKKGDDMPMKGKGPMKGACAKCGGQHATAACKKK